MPEVRADVPRRTLALVLFLVSFGIAGSSLITNRQLGFLGGLTDEWFLTGLNLRAVFTFGIVPGQPDVVLAPGYPAFVAVVALLFAGDPGSKVTGWTLGDPFVTRSISAVLFVQSLLLAASAVALFLFLSRRLRLEMAFAAGLVLGTNPYFVVVAGLLHYDILHIFLLVAGSWLLQWAADAPAPRRFLAAGAFWAVVAFVRSIALILPPFVFLGLLIASRRACWPALRHAAVFVLGMGLLIAPWAVRNRVSAGHLVPVNMEGWMALWGSTGVELPRDPNHSAWQGLYAGQFLPVFSRITGDAAYNRAGFIRFHGALEDAYRAEAFANIRARPAVYAKNVVRSFATFTLDLNSTLVRMFEAIQQPGVRMTQAWVAPGQSQDFLPTRGLALFMTFFYATTLLAACGLPLAILGRRLTQPAMVFLSILVAHSIVYMDFMYYYVKMPFLVLLAFVALDGIARVSLNVGRLLAALLTALSLATTALVLIN